MKNVPELCDKPVTQELDLGSIVVGSLLGYSEWLDTNGLLRPPPKNKRNATYGIVTHQQMVDAFIESKSKPA